MRNQNQCSFIKLTTDDTLEKLTTKYNTTKEEIISFNPGMDLENLITGQQLCIPLPATEEAVCPIGSIPYEVKQGESVSSIAVKFSTTVETILSTNPEINPNNLVVGQIICITEQLPKVIACPSMNIYVVNAGDTLYKIAQKFDITFEELMGVNPGLNLYNLIVGRIICLPLTPTPYIIVVNSENRLINIYYLGRFYKSYPVAIGKPSTPTPLGQFYILNKQVNPGGPFGSRWMGLSKPSYGIHGTNSPNSIGKAVSNGCIRMYNSNVEDLFSEASVNTPVIIT